MMRRLPKSINAPFIHSLNLAMSHNSPLFVTKDVPTEIGRWYAVYPTSKNFQPLIGKNAVANYAGISPTHVAHLRKNAICINTMNSSGMIVQQINLKDTRSRVQIVDCAVYSQAIRTAHAQFVARHHLDKCNKRNALTIALLNRNIDIYFAMSIARQYIPG